MSEVISARHGWRFNVNKRHKQRDRWKGTLPKLMPVDEPPKYRRYKMWARENWRRKVPPETGYGIAYEERYDK